MITFILTYYPLLCWSLSLIIAILSGTLTFLAKRSSNSKVKKYTDLTLEYVETILSKMSLAESLQGVDSSTKKHLVTTWIYEYCVNNEIVYDAEFVNELIEFAINFSKSVNIKEDKNG